MVLDFVPLSDVALECAGFLAGLGYDTSIMIRSTPLKGFDAVCQYSVVCQYSAHCALMYLTSSDSNHMQRKSVILTPLAPGAVRISKSLGMSTPKNF